LVFILILICCKPIPSTVNLQKESSYSQHALHTRRLRRSLRKTCHATAERLGENDTCYLIIKQVGYNTARLKRWGWEKNCMKEQIKGDRNQLGEYLRHGNNCCALSVTSYCLLHHIASFQSLVNVLLFVWTMEFVLMLLLTTCYHMPVIIEF
jgi:hypothetical protein